jgi:hypothetical protein
MNAQAQEVEQAFNDQRTATALATRQGVGAQQQHRPHRCPVVRCTHADRMADQQVVLE